MKVRKSIFPDQTVDDNGLEARLSPNRVSINMKEWEYIGW